MTTPAIVTGSRLEARCLPQGLRVECSGADAGRARHAARSLVEAGAGGLVSFGLAAALSPALCPGDLVLGECVVLPDDRRLAVDSAWRARLAGRLESGGIALASGAIAGTDRVLATPSMKRALFERTGALAADMESHAVAEVATEAGLPFVAVRAISDAADQTLPGAASLFLTEEGKIRATAVVGVAARPFELWALLRLGLHSRRGLRALRRAAGLLAPALGLG